MKKQLALFICVCLLVNVTSVFATQSSTITSYGFLKSDGSFLNSLDGVASVRAYADIKNSNYADNQNLGLLILECYANNTLIDTNSVTLFVDGNTASKRMVTDEIPIPQGDVYIKTYITYNSQVIFPEIIIDTDNGDESDYNSYLDEIALIEQLEIMGDGTGTEIDAHAPITRAELAVILIKLAAKEYLLPWETGTTPYSDVDESHWASRYISIVTKMGIMGEVSDGKFMPSSMLTYGQVIEALVTLLGYADTVDQWGYIVKANTIGITDGVSIVSNHYANRGKLAKLLVNSLDVPLMTQTGFGTYIEYIINDGTNNTTRRTLLNESFNIIKIKAMVEQTYDLSSSKKESLVQVEVLNAYRSIYGGKGEKFEEDTKVSIDAGKTNLKSFVGYKVIIYLYYDETSGDDPVALYVTKDISSADEITIAASDIEDIVKVGARCYEISYMASKDARSAEKFTVDADAKVYYNGQRDDRTLTTILNNFYGTASFALINPRDTEYDYDTVHISHYENAVVDSVNPIIGRVSVKEGRAIYFGENQPDYSSTLYDIDGKELDWSELEENDILSIRRTVGTNNRTVYVCTLVRNVVEGVIAEKTSEDDAEFKIGGAYYKTDNGIVYPDDLDLQYEGVFYLDIFGRIAYYEAQSSLSSNYAFVIDADVHSSGFENRLSVKAFTFDGEVVIFTGATRI
ncbi:MAG: S-layer homology domain-containing protein, partial [Firmicutes bacterium]|nr:S-layer homology domain-containing protein [Bacillota bacterium]